MASFRPARTIQEIADPTAIAYSKFIWNQRAGSKVYDLDNRIANAPDIFSLLDSEEVEDSGLPVSPEQRLVRRSKLAESGYTRL